LALSSSSGSASSVLNPSYSLGSFCSIRDGMSTKSIVQALGATKIIVPTISSTSSVALSSGTPGMKIPDLVSTEIKISIHGYPPIYRQLTTSNSKLTRAPKSVFQAMNSNPSYGEEIRVLPKLRIDPKYIPKNIFIFLI